MPVHTTYIQLEVDIHYEIEPPEFGLPEQVDIQSVTATGNHGSGRKQNLLKYKRFLLLIKQTPSSATAYSHSAANSTTHPHGVMAVVMMMTREYRALAVAYG